jgi:hypothetical protein
MPEDNKKNPKTVEQQHPALSGDEGTEVSKRNLDSNDRERFVKKYVVKLDPPGRDVQDYEHDANIKNVREIVLHHGLRLTGDVVFDGAEKHEDGVSTYLTYSGPVVPAVVAGDLGNEEGYVQKQMRDKEDEDN